MARLVSVRACQGKHARPTSRVVILWHVASFVSNPQADLFPWPDGARGSPSSGARRSAVGASYGELSWLPLGHCQSRKHQ